VLQIWSILVRSDLPYNSTKIPLSVLFHKQTTNVHLKDRCHGNVNANANDYDHVRSG